MTIEYVVLQITSNILEYFILNWIKNVLHIKKYVTKMFNALKDMLNIKICY